MCLNVHRQQGGPKFTGEFNKAGMPLFIADPFAGGARHLARREEDQHTGVLQMLFHLYQRRFRRFTAQVIHRDKQRT